MSITGSSSIRRLKDVAIVMDLHELDPVSGWAPGRRDGWWLERFAQVREDFPDRPWFRDECNEPDVAAAELLTSESRQAATRLAMLGEPWSSDPTRKRPPGTRIDT